MCCKAERKRGHPLVPQHQGYPSDQSFGQEATSYINMTRPLFREESRIESRQGGRGRSLQRICFGMTSRKIGLSSGRK